MTNESGLREKIARAIHDGLGQGWAYCNYGGDEWRDCRDKLDEAADAVLALISPAGEVGLTSFPPDEQNDVTGSASHTPAAAPRGMEG